MDKILSARVDEEALSELDRVTRTLRMTKKRFLEEAIRRHARELTADPKADVWAKTRGAWKRKEGAAEIHAAIRREFQESLDRHHRGRRARLHRLATS